MSINTLYSASRSFAMLTFLMTLFCVWDCYYFRSNLSLVLLMKVLLTKKACDFVFQFSKDEEISCQLSLFLCLSCISLGQYWQNDVVKSGWFVKKNKRGIWWLDCLYNSRRGFFKLWTINYFSCNEADFAFVYKGVVLLKIYKGFHLITSIYCSFNLTWRKSFI